MPKDSIHVVDYLIKDSCGCYTLFIKGDYRIGTSEIGWGCDACKKPLPEWPKKVRKGWKPSSFRPLQEQTAPLIKLTKVIEEQPVIAN